MTSRPRNHDSGAGQYSVIVTRLSQRPRSCLLGGGGSVPETCWTGARPPPLIAAPPETGARAPELGAGPPGWAPGAGQTGAAGSESAAGDERRRRRGDDDRGKPGG